MELLIKIPEAQKKMVDAFMELPPQVENDLISAIIHGTPLPKGHGRLTKEEVISKKAIMQVLAELGYGDEENGAEPEYMSALADVAKGVKAIKALEQKWIPVDYDRYPETYPKVFQEVWVTDGYGEVYHKAYDGTRSIKAWMPYIIPAPYKAESEDME